MRREAALDARLRDSSEHCDEERAWRRGMQEPLKCAALGSLSLSCRVEEAPAQDSMNTAGRLPPAARAASAFLAPSPVHLTETRPALPGHHSSLPGP